MAEDDKEHELEIQTEKDAERVGNRFIKEVLEEVTDGDIDG